MASPAGDSHEPLAVILQPYFLNQLQLSLLKICPSVIHLTITSFPVGLVLWEQKKKHLFAKNPFSFLIQVCLQPLQCQTLFFLFNQIFGVGLGPLFRVTSLWPERN